MNPNDKSVSQQVTPLAAELLRADPRVAQAKQLLQDALSEHSQRLTAQRAADPQRALVYQDLLAAFAAGRGAPLFYPYVSSGIGNGALVELIDGSVKYDFISGIGVHGWGHSSVALLESAIDAALSDTVMQGNLQQIPEAQDVVALFIRLANTDYRPQAIQKTEKTSEATPTTPTALTHCFLTSSGAMANENAFKIALQARFPAQRVLAFEHCFAGRTLGMAQVTDKAAYRDGLPQTLAVDYLPFYDYRDPEGSTQRAVQVLQAHLQRHPQQYAVMIMELIQGEGGYYPGSTEFFTAIITLLKQHKILVHIDEIQTFGRCAEPFAFQHFQLGAEVDMVSVGKMSQVCATLYRADLQPRAGLISQTFTSSSSAIFAARALLQHMLEPGLYGSNGHVAAVSAYLRGKLMVLSEKYPALISGPFGYGAMLACTPYPGLDTAASHQQQREQTLQLAKDLFTAGLLCFIAGNAPTRLRFLIPVAVVSNAEIDGAMDILQQVLSVSEY